MTGDPRNDGEITAIGMPYHGQAVGGTATFAAGTDYEKTVTIGAADPACRVVRHPLAPGATRTPDQQAFDAARGYVWRDYALLCGRNKCLNGGPALGGDSWLYCDSGGATWHMQIQTEVINPGASQALRISVWRKALFGRFALASPAAAQLTYVDFVPTLPPTYTGGFSGNHFVPDLVANDDYCLVPDSDGSDLLINVYHKGTTFPATNLQTVEGQYRSLLHVYRVALSGAGAPADGAGITAAITTEKAYAAISLDEKFEQSTTWGPQPAVPGLEHEKLESGSRDPYVVYGAPSAADVSAGRVVTVSVTCTAGIVNGEDTRGYELETNYDADLFVAHEGAVRRVYNRKQGESETLATSGEIVWELDYKARDFGSGPEWDALGFVRETGSVTLTREAGNLAGYGYSNTWDDRTTTISIFGASQTFVASGSASGKTMETVITSCANIEPEIGTITYFDRLVQLTAQGNAYGAGSGYGDLAYSDEVTLMNSSAAAGAFRYTHTDGVTAYQDQLVRAAGDGNTKTLYDAIDSYTAGGTAPLMKTCSAWQPITDEINVASSADTLKVYF